MKWISVVAVILLVVVATFLLGKNNINNTMKIESDIFADNGNIPVEYTCNGKGTQVPLKISGVPESAKSLALIVHDPDAPREGGFVHWVLWNINPKTSIIESGALPAGSVEGYTGVGKPGWIAPCPPSGVHRYIFYLYALDTILSIPESSGKTELLEAMKGHTIDTVKLTGLYGKDL
jgi:Raf kinase inhibitor-like YbhB/YbcL family protein